MRRRAVPLDARKPGVLHPTHCPMTRPTLRDRHATQAARSFGRECVARDARTPPGIGLQSSRTTRTPCALFRPDRARPTKAIPGPCGAVCMAPPLAPKGGETRRKRPYREAPSLPMKHQAYGCALSRTGSSHARRRRPAARTRACAVLNAQFDAWHPDCRSSNEPNTADRAVCFEPTGSQRRCRSRLPEPLPASRHDSEDLSKLPSWW